MLATHSEYITSCRNLALNYFLTSSFIFSTILGLIFRNFCWTGLQSCLMGRRCTTISVVSPCISSYDHANISLNSHCSSIRPCLVSLAMCVPIFNSFPFSKAALSIAYFSQGMICFSSCFTILNRSGDIS